MLRSYVVLGSYVVMRSYVVLGSYGSWEVKNFEPHEPDVGKPTGRHRDFLMGDFWLVGEWVGGVFTLTRQENRLATSPSRERYGPDVFFFPEARG